MAPTPRRLVNSTENRADGLADPPVPYRFDTAGNGQSISPRHRRNEKAGITSNLHTATFNVDEESLRISTGLMAWLAVSELARD